MKTSKRKSSPGPAGLGTARANSPTRGILSAGASEKVAARTGRKWAWHQRALLGLRDRLLTERGEQLAAAAEPLEPHNQSPADSASDEFDHDVALGELSSEQDALFEIEEALNRIRSGTYGVCQGTGKPIPPERLKAIPWTRFGREVEARLEREGVVTVPRLGTLGSVREKETGDLRESEPRDENGIPEPEDETLREDYSPPGVHFRPPKTVRAPRRRNRDSGGVK